MGAFLVWVLTFFGTITAVPFQQSSPDIYFNAGTDFPRLSASANMGASMPVQNAIPHANSATDLQPAGDRLLSLGLNPDLRSTSPDFFPLGPSPVDSAPQGSSYSTAQINGGGSNPCPRAALQTRFNQLALWQAGLSDCLKKNPEIMGCLLPNNVQGDEVLLGGLGESNNGFCPSETEDSLDQYQSELARSEIWYNSLKDCQNLVNSEAEAYAIVLAGARACVRKDDPIKPPGSVQPGQPLEPAPPGPPVEPGPTIIVPTGPVIIPVRPLPVIPPTRVKPATPPAKPATSPKPDKVDDNIEYVVPK
ncbi:hypothetical protein MMC07_005945 [Pseudocyphellaria aurata]|nr:hypothetical protein [Pseudocyphellaria aurata]